jgi:hypothetical protein
MPPDAKHWNARILPAVEPRPFDPNDLEQWIRRLRGDIGRHMPVPKRVEPWWLYFIQGDDGGPIKIGRTLDPARRITRLQTGYPFGQLRFIALVRAFRSSEASLHEFFAEHRIRGEWFAPGDSVLDVIEGFANAGKLDP